jgi:hypothetical protein
MLLGGLLTVLAVVAVSPSGLANIRVRATYVFRGPGIVLRYPSGLYVSNRVLDSMTNPVQRLVLSTYRLPGGRLNQDGTYEPPATGVIAELLEEVPPSDPAFQAPLRPRQFALPKLNSHLERSGSRWGEIPFRDHGRDLYIFLGVGPGASQAKVALVLRTLDGLTITAAPPSVIGA